VLASHLFLASLLLLTPIMLLGSLLLLVPLLLLVFQLLWDSILLRASLLFLTSRILLVSPAVSSVTALAGVNDASDDVVGVLAVARFHALACFSTAAIVPAELEYLLLLVLPTFADVSCCCWRFRLLLAFFVGDVVLAIDGVPNYAGTHDAAGISAAAGAPPVRGISAFAGDPVIVGFPAVP